MDNKKRLIKKEIGKKERDLQDYEIYKTPYEEEIKENMELLKKESGKTAKLSDEEMFSHLIADPELIFSEGYKGFGGSFNDELVSAVNENKSDIDKARKEIKKIRKMMILA